MAQRLPLFATANGLHRLSVSEENPDPRNGSSGILTALPENTWTFTDVSYPARSLHFPFSRLAKFKDSWLLPRISVLRFLSPSVEEQLLKASDVLFVQEWHASGRHRFPGNPNEMGPYVDHFLSSLRADFPTIIVRRLGGPDILAQARRMPGNLWNGDLGNYKPKQAVGLYYNQCRVADMVRATDKMWQTKNGKSSEERRESSRMLKRHRQFQFMFAVATSHELCHAFVGYLAQNSQDDTSYTPPNVSHLNHGYFDEGGEPLQGESGRWFENRLFGGSFEFYYDSQDGRDQVGIPYILDRHDVAWRIDPRALDSFVQTPRSFEFPLRIVGNGVNSQQRRQLQLRSLGSTPAATPLATRPNFMRARREGPALLYTITKQDLESIPTVPRPLRAVRVA